METIFIKRFIRSEADLPKVAGKYYAMPCFEEDLIQVEHYGNETSDLYWSHDFDYWLQPTTLAELIKEKLPSEAIEKKAKYEYPELWIAFKHGAEYAINKLTE